MATYSTIKGFTIQSLASDPSPLVEGQVWYNSTSATLKGSPNFLGTGAWSSGGAMNTPYKYGGAYVGTQIAGVYAGGIPGDVTTTQTYNGTAWSASPAVLQDGRHYIECCGIGTQTAAQIEGGESPAVVGVTEQFNGSTWSEVADLNVSRIAVVGAGTQAAGLAMTGGHNPGSNSMTNVESWNDVCWATATAAPHSKKYAMGGGTQASAIIAGGNQYPPSISGLTTSEVWDGSAWTEVSVINTGRASGGRSATDGTAAIIFGGSPPPQNANTEQWNGSTWTEVADLAQGRNGVSGDGSVSAGIAAGGNPPNTGLTEEWNVPVAITAKTFTSS